MAFIERMKGQDYIDATRKYLDYLEEHLENVRRAFIEISMACEGMWWVVDDYHWHTLRQEVVYHDVSKFSPEEFVQYRKSFYPISDAEKEMSNFDSAWAHHKEANHHHHETVQTFLDIVHMVIDWTAMGYRFGGTAKTFYEKNRDKIVLSDEKVLFLYEIFECINRAEIKRQYQERIKVI